MSSKKNIGFKELKNNISENIYKICEFKKDNNFHIKENINLNEDTSYNHLNYYKNLIKKKCNYL